MHIQDGLGERRAGFDRTQLSEITNQQNQSPSEGRANAFACGVICILYHGLAKSVEPCKVPGCLVGHFLHNHQRFAVESLHPEFLDPAALEVARVAVVHFGAELQLRAAGPPAHLDCVDGIESSLEDVPSNGSRGLANGVAELGLAHSWAPMQKHHLREAISILLVQEMRSILIKQLQLLMVVLVFQGLPNLGDGGLLLDMGKGRPSVFSRLRVRRRVGGLPGFEGGDSLLNERRREGGDEFLPHSCPSSALGCSGWAQSERSMSSLGGSKSDAHGGAKLGCLGGVMLTLLLTRVERGQCQRLPLAAARERVKQIMRKSLGPAGCFLGGFLGNLCFRPEPAVAASVVPDDGGDGLIGSQSLHVVVHDHETELGDHGGVILQVRDPAAQVIPQEGEI